MGEKFANSEIYQAMIPSPQFEAGLIAHDTWNAGVEFRHLVRNVDEPLTTNFIDGVLQEDHKTLNSDEQTENAYLSIDYKMFVPYLIASIQELNMRITQLEGN